MARKPIPGSDEGLWGNVLNEYLDVIHDDSGALRPGSVTSTSLSSDVVAQIQTATQGPAGPQGPQGNPGPQGPSGSSVWDDITDKPLAFTPSTHSHDVADLSAGNWKLLNSNGLGEVTEIDVGAQGQVLTGSGVASAPSFADPVINYVTVVTGSEPRPVGSMVIWVGGVSQPTNMLGNDIWLEEQAD